LLNSSELKVSCSMRRATTASSRLRYCVSSSYARRRARSTISWTSLSMSLDVSSE